MKEDEIPLRETCNLDDPEEMFWWMHVSMPELRGALALMPFEYYRLMSKRLHDLGARLKCDACGHMAEPLWKLRLPQTEEHWITGLGRWVPVDEPDPPRMEVDDLVRSMKPEMRKQLEHSLGVVNAEDALHSTKEETVDDIP